MDLQFYLFVNNRHLQLSVSTECEKYEPICDLYVLELFLCARYGFSYWVFRIFNDTNENDGEIGENDEL